MIISSTITQLIILFTRSGTYKSVNKVIHDLTNDNTKHYIGRGTFALAIGYVNLSSHKSTPVLLDQTYFSISAVNEIEHYENKTIVGREQSIDYGP